MTELGLEAAPEAAVTESIRDSSSVCRAQPACRHDDPAIGFVPGRKPGSDEVLQRRLHPPCLGPEVYERCRARWQLGYRQPEERTPDTTTQPQTDRCPRPWNRNAQRSRSRDDHRKAKPVPHQIDAPVRQLAQVPGPARPPNPGPADHRRQVRSGSELLISRPCRAGGDPRAQRHTQVTGSRRTASSW